MLRAHNIAGLDALYCCMAPTEFTSIAQVLRPKLLTLGRDFFGDAASAEDAVQEALMKLWTAWQQLPSRVDAERLAVRLTKHACIDAMRRRHTERVLPLEETQPTEAMSEASASDTLHEREVREAVAKTLNLLRPSERRLWTMFAEAQMETAQIAAATGINIRTVSATLSTARRKIMNELKKGGIL